MRSDVREEVWDFAVKMEFKLSLHDDRPGWKGCETQWLLERLKQEIAEVEQVLEKKGDGWLTKLWMECADVGNFAMMIQDAEAHRFAERTAKKLEEDLR